MQVTKKKSIKARNVLDKINFVLRKAVCFFRMRRSKEFLLSLKSDHPDFFKPIDKEREDEFKEYWGKFGFDVDIRWLRVFHNFFGVSSKYMMPDEYQQGIFTRIINFPEYAFYEQDKNNLERLFDKKYFPKAYLRRIRGSYLDGDYNFLSQSQAEDIFKNLKRDLVVKPARDTHSGDRVEKISYREGGYFDKDSRPVTLDFIEKCYQDNYLIQEVLEQHEFFKNLNPGSVNSLRLVTYRSVKDNQVHVIMRCLKMGRGNCLVDNCSAGGVIVKLRPDGSLSDFGFDKNLKKVFAHPNLKYEFKGMNVPMFEKIEAEARKMAASFIHQRFLGIDITLDKDGNVRIFEANIMGVGLFTMQSSENGLYGEYTDEMAEYCRKNKDKDDFRIIRI